MLPLQGQYPVIREDAAQMCALQMQAEFGPTLANNSAEFDSALEKFLVKQVSTYWLGFISKSRVN